MMLDNLYKFSPEAESKLEVTLRDLDTREREMLKGMRRCQEGSVEWHVCALWARIFKNEKDDYQTVASIMRSVFYLWERHDEKLKTRTDEQMEALAREKLETVAEEFLTKIAEKGQTKVKPIDPRIVS